MQKELILTVTTHRKFGVIISPFIITPINGNTFYSSIEKANTINVKEVSDYNETYLQIVKLIGEYDDTYIAGLFTKKKEDARTFIQNVDYEFIELRIRPHIEKRLHKLIKLIEKSNVPVYFKDRKYAKIYRTDLITFAGSSAKAIFNFNRNDEGIQYFLSIRHQGIDIKLKNKKALILTQSPCSIVIDEKLYYFDDLDSKKLLPFFEKEYIHIPRQTEKTYFEKFIYNTIKQFEVCASGFTIDEEKLSFKPLLYLQNSLSGEPVLLLKYKYGSKVILPNNPDHQFIILECTDNDYRFIKNNRDIEAEDQLKSDLKTIGLKSSDNIHFYPSDTGASNSPMYQLLQWINEQHEQLQNLGIEIRQDFFEQKYFTKNISLTLSVNDENDWFDIRGTVTIGEFTIPFIKLRKNILRNIREYELPDGTIAILPEEWFAKYKEIFLFAENNQDGLSLNKMHFNLLNSNVVGISNRYSEEIKKLFETQYSQNAFVPDNLKASLRPYQITGFNWMAHLKANNFGGCLADDMGLGKTLQTLTLLLETSLEAIDEPTPPETKQISQLSLFETPAVNVSGKKIKPTSLIVMPASLIHNWKNEIGKFTPDLKPFVHTGNNRTKDVWSFKDADIVLTTYGVIRNDIDVLKLFPFHYLILDESQVIKNPDSKIYKSIIQLKAKHKLVLTGTPIENSLTDLWSQMNFVNRGLLGSFTFFKNEFVQPIEKHNDEQKSQKLQTLIHPFILRRTKEQVAKDLPPRTEQVCLCEMSEKQRKIYEEEKSLVRNNILENMEKNGSERSAMIVLQALTRLRQLANHPLLVDVEEESGKFEEVTRMLMNVVEEGHKVLIFSSFVQHLELYAQYLDENNLKYAILTGKTQNREQVIDHFQNDEHINVFLISLKAGGVGLNLTAADYVFLLDPWWNPAAENQAINRAHRIGQEKNVFVYRFISENSIEEKIVNLQNRKSELADLFINNNNPFKALTPDKIRELFD